MKLVRVHAAPQLGLVLGVSSRFVARQSVPRRRRDGSRWCRASDIALWRRACEHSPAPLRALPARTPCERYLNLSSKPAGGSQLPPPPPPRRGRSSAIIACITVQSVPGTLEAQNQPIRDQLVPTIPTSKVPVHVGSMEGRFARGAGRRGRRPGATGLDSSKEGCIPTLKQRYTTD